MNSSMFGGSGALAEYMDAGSAPMTMHTGIFSPRPAISRQCAAPVLWRCQCMATERLSNCCTRYIPTLRMPREGSLLMTAVIVKNGPPSSGHVVSTGILSRSISSPCHTTSWQGGAPCLRRGGNLATSSSRGSNDSLPISPSGTLRSISCVIRAPCSSRSCTPRLSAMRFIEPNRLIATGNVDAVPSRRMGRSNNSAGPPPGSFMAR